MTKYLSILTALVLPSVLWAAPDNSEWRHERQEWTFSLEGKDHVDVTNQWGDLRIRTHDKNEVYVLANIQRHQDDPRAMDLVLDEESKPLGITAYFPEKHQGAIPADWQQRRIDLTLFVPAAIKLKGETNQGLAEARGLAGPLELKTYTGDIALRIKGPVTAHSQYGDIQTFFLRTDWSQPVHLETLTGSIEAILPTGANAEVDVATHGQITTDFSITIQRDENEEGKTGHASIGTKGQALTLKSNRGAIRLLSSVIPDPSVTVK